ncbi:class F sortase [Marinococcus sp. PL1-022]|uniref:class F sortase n=1 Tax=Marinococcus sp. PL1-022 TaxID=3095363 RepID=UPI0029C4E8EF|nr:class F sortase [Marinococcus sp. PL1-022]MDX6152719.1 class F sortase [Marinococcus sp. PL1-022]
MTKRRIKFLILAAMMFVAIGLGIQYAQQALFSSPAETTVLSEGEGVSDPEENEEPGESSSSQKVEEFVQVTDNTEANEKTEEAEEMELAAPSTLSIPSIDVEADLEGVGVLDNGQMGVPDSAEGVGWFEPGVTPGEQGNAVMAGHVDSKSGPAVFFDLEDMKAGDDVNVTNEDGQELTFTVTKVVSYPRQDAPIENIFGASDGRHLQLITCTGTFNQEQGTHDERLVVYTELTKESEEALMNDGDEASDPPPSPDNVSLQGSLVKWHAVRDEDIAGYRVYRQEEGGDDFTRVASVDAHERKSYTETEEGAFTYHVTAVDTEGVESKPSEDVSMEE